MLSAFYLICMHMCAGWEGGGTCDVLGPSPRHISMRNGMNVFILCTLCVLYLILTSETKDKIHAGHDINVFIFIFQ